MLMKIGAGLLATTLGLSVGAGVAVQQYGTVVVRVEEKGPSGHAFTIPVPMALARIAAGFVPISELHAAGPDLRLASQVAAVVTGELAKYPDTVLVQVEDHEDSVLVVTTGESLLVDINSPQERVTVKVPLWGASQVLEALADRADHREVEAVDFR